MLRVLQLPSCVGSDASFQYLAAFLVNDVVALDAGSLGFWGDVAQQARVRHVFLTHSHLDHLASLPVFLENVGIRGEPVNVYGTAEVMQVLQSDIFNNRLFPDFIRISREGKPFLALHSLVPGQPVTAAGLRLTPVAVDHVVPTVAFVVEDDVSAIAYITDTAPTTAIWQRLQQTANLKAIFLEATFPQSQAWLADVSKHLTTATFAGELAKAPPGVPVYAIHLKARFRAEIVAELAKLPGVSVCEPGRVYEF